MGYRFNQLKAMLLKEALLLKRSKGRIFGEIIFPILVFLTIIYIFKTPPRTRVPSHSEYVNLGYIVDPENNFPNKSGLYNANSRCYRDENSYIAIYSQNQFISDYISSALPLYIIDDFNFTYFQDKDSMLKAIRYPKDPSDKNNSELCNVAIAIEQKGKSFTTTIYTDRTSMTIPQFPFGVRFTNIPDESTFITSQIISVVQTLVENAVAKFECPSCPSFSYAFSPMKTKDYYTSDFFGMGLFLIAGFVIIFPLTFAQNLLTRMQEEKGNKIRDLMRVMGLRNSMFFCSYYLFEFIVSFLCNLLLTFTAIHLFMLNTNFILLFLIILINSVSNTPIIFILNSVFNNPRVARAVTGIVLLLLAGLILIFVYFTIISNVALGIFGLFLPYFSIIGLLKFMLLLDQSSPVGFGFLVQSFEGINIIIYVLGMITSQLLWLFLAFYVEEIMGSENTQGKSFLFFLDKNYWFGDKTSKATNNDPEMQVKLLDVEDTEKDNPNYEPINASLESLRNSKKLISLSKLNKVYEDGTVAVKNVSLDMYEGQIFAFLGHNGAGKTTTISIISGLLSATSGNVVAYGTDLLKNYDNFRDQIGICQQSNTSYNDLTIEEHLRIFSTFKGFSYDELRHEAEKLMTELKIDHRKDFLVSTLSGGEIRKLMLTISLLGTPKILMLDEPTTGLDASSRRLVWDTLTQYKKGKVILLTTHYMDEADFLGDRIGIISEGQIKACGSSLFLKQKFGEGYHLTIIKQQNAQGESITNFIKSKIELSQLKSEIGTELIYNLPYGSVDSFENLINELELAKANLGIDSYGLTMTTLEDVFMKAGKKEKVDKIKTSVEKENLVFSVMDLEEKSYLFRVISDTKLVTWRRFLQSIRTPAVIIFQVIFPVVMFFIYVGILKFITQMNYGSELNIQPSSFHEKQEIFVNQYYYGTTKPTTDAISLDPRYFSINPKYQNSFSFLEDQLLDFDDSMYNYLQAYQTNPSYGGYYFYSNNKTCTAFIFGNITGPMSPLAFANYLSNYTLSKIDPEISVQTKIDPIKAYHYNSFFSYTLISSIYFIIFLGSAFAQTAGWQCLFVMKERVQEIKKQQIISGMTLLGYWLGNFIAEVLKNEAPMIIMIIVYIAMSIKMPYAWIFMIMYPISGTVFAFMFSFIVSTENVALTIPTIISLIVGLSGATSIPIILLLGVKSKIITTCNLIFQIVPIYNLLAGLNMTLYATIFNIPGSVCNNLMNYGCLLQYLVGIIFDFLLFGTIVLAIEYLRKYYMRSNITMLEGDGNFPTVRDDDVIRCQQMLVQDPLSPSAISAVKCRKLYGGVNAVDCVSFGIDYGEIFALLGVNGAGKTTTFNMITGSIKPTNGFISINKQNIFNTDVQTHAKYMGYCPQSNTLFESFTAWEHIYYYAKIKQIPNVIIDKLMNELINSLKYKGEIHKYSQNLSGGNKRKLCLANALIGNPPIILLDEPSAGLDPRSRRCMWKVISRITKEWKKCAVILTTHSMEEAETLCTKLCIMVLGNLRCYGPTQHIKEKYASAYIFSSRISTPSDEEIKKYISDLRLENAHLNFEEGKRILNSMNANDSVQELKQDGIGDYLNDKLIKYTTVPAEDIITYGIYYLKRKETYNNIFSFVNQISIIKETIDSLEIEIPRQSSIIAKMFTLGQSLKTRQIIKEYSVSQTTLDHIFQKFARGTEKSEPITSLTTL